MTVDELAIRFTLAIGHALWQVTAIAVFAFAAVKLTRLAASTRYSIHAAALLVSTFCLPINFLMLGDRVSEISAPVGVEQSAELTPSPTTPVKVTEPIVESAKNLETPVLQESAKPTLTLYQKSAPWVVLFYVVGVGLMLLRLLVAVFATARLRSRSDPVTCGIWAEALDRLADTAKPALAWSANIAGPVIVGLVKPVILLPMSLATHLHDSTSRGCPEARTCSSSSLRSLVCARTAVGGNRSVFSSCGLVAESSAFRGP